MIVRQFNNDFRANETSWSYMDNSYIRGEDIKQFIRALNNNRNPTNIKVWLYQLVSATTKSDVKALTSSLKNHTIVYGDFYICQHFIALLPAFEGKHAETLTARFNITNLLDKTDLQSLLNFLRGSKRMHTLHWDPLSGYYEVIQNVLAELEEIKVYKPDRVEHYSIIRKVLNLRNIKMVCVDLDVEVTTKESYVHKINLYCRVSSVSSVKAFKFQKMKRFDKCLISFMKRVKQDVRFYIEILVKSSREIKNFELLWPMLQTKKRVVLQILEARRDPSSTFNKNGFIKYPKRYIFQALATKQISSSANLREVLGLHEFDGQTGSLKH